jgi:hypothetical protein
VNKAVEKMFTTWGYSGITVAPEDKKPTTGSVIGFSDRCSTEAATP